MLSPWLRSAHAIWSTETARVRHAARLRGRVAARSGGANDPLFVAERPPRVAGLSALDELQRVEEALATAVIAAGQAVHRLPAAAPTAVLDVRVVDRVLCAA